MQFDLFAAPVDEGCQWSPFRARSCRDNCPRKAECARKANRSALAASFWICYRARAPGALARWNRLRAAAGLHPVSGEQFERVL